MNDEVFNVQWMTSPIASLGAEVFVRDDVRLGECFVSNVEGYETVVLKSNKKNVMILRGYRLPRLCISSRVPYWPIERIYVNEKAAEEDARMIEVRSLTNEEWVDTIGINQEGERVNIDECELMPCCANISDIRDLLQKCRKQDGLETHDRNLLLRLVSEHSWDVPKFKILPSILESLGIGLEHYGN